MIGRDEAAYLGMIVQLKRPGVAWPRDDEAAQNLALKVLASELAAADERAAQLVEEADPRTTFELLPEWERAFGLPDSCTGPANTLQERLQVLLQRITGQAGQSIAFFIGLADRLGYAGVTIEEFGPAFQCGISECGVGEILVATAHFNWKVAVPGPRVTFFRCGESECGIDPLTDIDRAEDLECLFERLKPAHTNLIFSYEGA